MSGEGPLKVLSARAVHVAVSALAAEFARDGGRKTEIVYAPIGVLQQKLAAGEDADVVILTPQALERLETSNRLVAGSRRVLGRTGIGVAVRTGAEKPDIATPQGFKQALLAAGSVALSDPAVGGSAGLYLHGLLARMGIAEAVDGKARLQPSGAAVAESVARGEADIGMTFISEMLPVNGISIVGPLPPPLGNDTTYAAAVLLSSIDPVSALAFIATLSRPDRRNVWNASGFAPASGP